MALLIRITTDYDEDKTPAQQIDEAMAALGFVRKSSSLREALAPIVEKTGAAVAAFHNPATGETVVVEPPQAEPDTRGIMNVGLEHAEAARGLGVDYLDAKALAELTMPVRGPDPDYAHPSGRKFGVAGDGRKRRTKGEMAEDEAYLARLDAQGAAPTTGQEEATAEEVVEMLVAADVDAETVAQDTADEAAEAEAEKPAGGPLTLEDLRRAIGDYAKKHGIPKAQANVPAILGAPMLEVTDFETAVARVKLATATSDGLLHESDTNPRATKDDLMEAVMAYAAKYEGKGVNPASGGPTAVDLADVMRKTFLGTSGALSEIPATPEGYGAALAAVNDAINDNPFKREVK